MSRIEKLAEEYGTKVGCDCYAPSHFLDGYRRALADMQAIEPPTCWWGQPDFGELMAAVAKDLEE